MLLKISLWLKMLLSRPPLLVLRSDLSSLAVLRFPNCSVADTSFLSQFTFSLNSFHPTNANDYYLLPLCINAYTNAHFSIAGTENIPKIVQKQQQQQKDFKDFKVSTCQHVNMSST